MTDTSFKNMVSTVEENLPQIQKVLNTYQQENFPKRNPEFFCLELCGEAGELANLEKKLWKGKDIPRERVEDETADVFIAILNYADARGIDLAKVVAEKLRTIEARRLERAARGEVY